MTVTNDAISQLVLSCHPFNGRLGRNIRKLIETKKIIAISSPDIARDRWNGDAYITFSDDATIEEIVNYVISPSRADEISIKEKTLRLWWD